MLSRLARKFAAEIASHDWSDAPYRLDRAGHQRSTDARKSEHPPLTSEQTDRVRMNVAWVVAQVLAHEDPNLNVDEFAAACAVPRAITHRKDGSLSGVVQNGLRWKDPQASIPEPPGAPLWRVQLRCGVANVVVFRRLLAKSDGLDPTVPGPVVAAEVEPAGGSTRLVILILRAWNPATAQDRAVAIVNDAGAELGATPAVVLDVHTFDPDA